MLGRSAAFLLLAIGCSGPVGTLDAGMDAGAADGGRDAPAAIDAPDAPPADVSPFDAPSLDGSADTPAAPDAPSADVPAPADASAIASFTDTYVGWDVRAIRGAEVPYAIEGREPTDGTRHPLFVFLIGTGGAHTLPFALAWIDEMAARGFVAASVEYDNDVRFGCGSLTEKAAGIFADPDSALAVLCARASADCSAGIVLAGHSQGSFMALLARDHDPRVRGVLALGTGTNLVGPGADHTACLVTSRVLPSSLIRATNGASDGSYGSADAMRAGLDLLTGSSCGAAASTCLRADGTGWNVALDADVTDGDADHCYYNDEGTTGMSCTAPLDPAWLGTPDPWGRAAGARWLAALVGL